MWSVRIKKVSDDSRQFDSVGIEFEFYDIGGNGKFTEIHRLSSSGTFKDIENIVIGKLLAINLFRKRVEMIKDLIGIPLPKDENQATNLGLSAEEPTPK